MDYSLITRYPMAEGADILCGEVDTADAKRCIFISDLHGRPDLLKRLLDKVKFSSGDMLFLLGDLCEKGPDSLGMVRYAMKLSSQKNTFVIQGNCDPWGDIIKNKRQYIDILKYMLIRKESILHEMARNLDVEISNRTDITMLTEAMLRNYSLELDFLSGLPHVIETTDAILVHSSIETDRPPYAKLARRLTKSDFWMPDARLSDKWVICGHTPVKGYCTGVADMRPRIDYDKRVIHIDGGNIIIAGGQLNALILENGEFSSMWVDDFTVMRVKKAQEASLDPYTVSWPNSKVRVLSAEGEFSNCYHEHSGREISVPTAMVYKENGGDNVLDFTDYNLPLTEGDEVSVITRYGDSVYCKKDGILGWAHGDMLE